MSDLTSWLSRQQAEHQRKLSAWHRAQVVPGYDPDQYRRDAYGSWIAWNEYAQQTMYGWEIDHELPKAHFPNVASQPANLRALHWKNNRTKSDKIGVDTLRRILGGA